MRNVVSVRSESSEVPLYTEEQLNSDLANTKSISTAAVFDLLQLKVTVCLIPLKVDERGNRGIKQK